MKKKPIPWFRVLRIASQLSYIVLAAFAVLGRNFVIAGILMGASFLAGAFFCGWFCPFGLMQETLGRLGRRILRGRRLRVPPRAERWFLLSRYVLMITGVTGLAALGFLNYLSGPYTTFMGFVSGNMGYIGTFAWVWFGVTLAASLFMDRPFCRYFCVEGARHGVLSLARIFSIRRDSASCVSCGRCDKACPTQVGISNKGHVRNPQCVNCMECIAACPVNGALTYGPVFGGRKIKESKKEVDHESEVA